MRLTLSSAVCAAVIAALTLASPVSAKTAKECQKEWRANKAANEKAGITEKDYVAKCRGEATETKKETKTKEKAAKEKSPKEEKTKAASKKPETTGAKKTVKACQQEWRANKAANEKAGITEKAYVEKCRASETAAQPTAMPSPMAPAKQEKAFAPAKSERTATPAPATGQPSSANQFVAESQAKRRCPGGTVVWANLESKIYHFEGHADYGHTKKGAYMCENDALSQGIRAAKNEKHP